MNNGGSKQRRAPNDEALKQNSCKDKNKDDASSETARASLVVYVPARRSKLPERVIAASRRR